MSRNPRLVPIAAAFYGPILGLAILWGWLRDLWVNHREPGRQGWWAFESSNEIALAVVAGCVLAALAIALSWQMTRTVPGVRQLSERVSLMLAGQTGRNALLLALFSSVGEEFLFRGCIQSEFGFWPATLLFAIVHVGRERVWLWWTASAFIAGIGLGLLYEHYGGLLAPIVMHFVINAVNIHILAKQGLELKSQGLIPNV